MLELEKMTNMTPNSDCSVDYNNGEGQKVNIYRGVDSSLEISNNVGVIYLEDTISSEDLKSVLDYMCEAQKIYDISNKITFK